MTARDVVFVDVDGTLTTEITGEEDDELLRQMTSAQLASLGYRVIAAANGPEALERLASEPQIDLLLTDIAMPGGMNGRQLAERAREARPGLAVLYTSGYAESTIFGDGTQDADIPLLNKPYRRKEMAAKVREALDRRR